MNNSHSKQQADLAAETLTALANSTPGAMSSGVMIPKALRPQPAPSAFTAVHSTHNTKSHSVGLHHTKLSDSTHSSSSSDHDAHPTNPPSKRRKIEVDEEDFEHIADEKERKRRIRYVNLRVILFVISRKMIAD